jgi:hypothetical protein
MDAHTHYLRLVPLLRVERDGELVNVVAAFCLRRLAAAAAATVLVSSTPPSSAVSTGSVFLRLDAAELLEVVGTVTGGGMGLGVVWAGSVRIDVSAVLEAAGGMGLGVGAVIAGAIDVVVVMVVTVPGGGLGKGGLCSEGTTLLELDVFGPGVLELGRWAVDTSTGDMGGLGRSGKASWSSSSDVVSTCFFLLPAFDLALLAKGASSESSPDDSSALESEESEESEDDDELLESSESVSSRFLDFLDLRFFFFFFSAFFLALVCLPPLCFFFFMVVLPPAGLVRGSSKYLVFV